MGVFDQAARYASQVDPDMVPKRLLLHSGLYLTFREWLETRSLPLPGGSDRTADRVASLIDPQVPDQPWLMVLEFQSQPDPDKIDVILEEVAILRSRVRFAEDRKQKYRVLAGLVHLQGHGTESMIDMTLPDGTGTRFIPRIWNIAEDSASQTLDQVVQDTVSWGMLFWIPLMTNGGEEEIIKRWKELVLDKVNDRRLRSDLGIVALVIADLSGCYLNWKRLLEDFEMTESQVVNEWINKGALVQSRQTLIRLLQRRFPGSMSDEILRLINEQESLSLLNDWFDAGLSAFTFDEFLEYLKR